MAEFEKAELLRITRHAVDHYETHHKRVVDGVSIDLDNIYFNSDNVSPDGSTHVSLQEIVDSARLLGRLEGVWTGIRLGDSVENEAGRYLMEALVRTRGVSAITAEDEEAKLVRLLLAKAETA